MRSAQRAICVIRRKNTTKSWSGWKGSMMRRPGNLGALSARRSCETPLNIYRMEGGGRESEAWRSHLSSLFSTSCSRLNVTNPPPPLAPPPVSDFVCTISTFFPDFIFPSFSSLPPPFPHPSPKPLFLFYSFAFVDGVYIRNVWGG